MPSHLPPPPNPAEVRRAEAAVIKAFQQAERDRQRIKERIDERERALIAENRRRMGETKQRR